MSSKLKRISFDYSLFHHVFQKPTFQRRLFLETQVKSHEVYELYRYGGDSVSNLISVIVITINCNNTGESVLKVVGSMELYLSITIIVTSNRSEDL